MLCLDENTVLDLATNRLSPANASSARAHLDVCDECRGLVAEIMIALPPAQVLAVPPMRVARYIITDWAGEGGMGVVYQAHDPELDRIVALKLVRPDRLTAHVRDRVLREAKALAKLRHPNVIDVYDAGQHEGQFFIAMAFIPGQSVRAWLRERPRAAADVLHVFSQAGAGLHAAHAAGIVHCDFKPDNVLIGDDGSVCVVDFGLARSLGGDERGSDPVLAGTPAYMAPEQLAGGEPDERSDQFSFCVSLYEALYGHHPRARHHHVHDAMSSRPPPTVPPRIRRALARGLSPDPRDRFAAMDALLAALRSPPQARRWTHVLGGMLVVAFAAAPHVADSGSCRETTRAVDDIWSRHRDGVLHGFIASEEPYADAGFRRVEEAVHRYVGELREVEHAICESRAADAVIVAQRTCAAHRKAELEGLLATLSTSVPALVASAPQSVAMLAPPAHCLHIRPSASGSDADALEADVTRATLAAELFSDLARARAQRFAGAHDIALAELDDVAARGREAGMQAVVAEALLARAATQFETTDAGVAEQTLWEAFAAAERARRDDLRAQVLLSLGAMFAYDARTVHRAPQLLEAARAAMLAAGSEHQHEHVLEWTLGLLEHTASRYDAARPHFEHAVALGAQSLGVYHPSVAQYELALGNTLAKLGHELEAITVLERALEHMQATLGDHNPRVAAVRHTLAAELANLDRCDEAIAELEQAVAVLEATMGPESDNALAARGDIGFCLGRLGRVDEAVALYGALVRLWQAREDVPQMAKNLVQLGDVYFNDGDVEQAQEAYAEAVAVAKRSNPATVLFEPLARQGEALLVLGRPAEASEVLADAVALAERHELPPLVQAAARFVLGRALWQVGEDDERALALVLEARNAFAEVAESPRSRLAEVEAWLRESQRGYGPSDRALDLDRHTRQ